MISDERLFQDYLQGDASAFEELFTRYQESVFQLAIKNLQNEESALKVLHQTFARIHTLRKKYSPRHTFAQWVFVIAKSEINRMTKSGPKVAFAEEIPSMSLLNPEPFSPKSFAEQLDEAGSRLDHEKEELLKMRYIDGLAFEEIADELGLNAVSFYERLKWTLKRGKVKRWKQKSMPPPPLPEWLKEWKEFLKMKPLEKPRPLPEKLLRRIKKDLNLRR